MPGLDIKQLEVKYDTHSPIETQTRIFESATHIGNLLFFFLHYISLHFQLQLTIFLFIFFNFFSFFLSFFLGLRPAQEDRFFLCPRLFSDKLSILGVFDGTVGDHASEFLRQNFLSVVLSHPSLVELVNLIKQEDTNPSKVVELITIEPLVNTILRDSFYDCDKLLIQMAAEKSLHYTSSTGIVCFLWKNHFTMAHVGDSKACICKIIYDANGNSNLEVSWLTRDHKPNDPNELRRIQASGGSLAYLHGNRPYIRGGDFIVRQAKGEHPKQLNYSRAFGGKDLKMYGLSIEPDINNFLIQNDDEFLVVGSDGLWDALSPIVICDIIAKARKEGHNARNCVEILINCAIKNMPKVNIADNVTASIVFFKNDQQN